MTTTPLGTAFVLTTAMVAAHNSAANMQVALKNCNAVTALVLPPLIARAAALQADISALIDALNATE